MYNIKCNRIDPYEGSIVQFIKREFPVFVKSNDLDMLDLLTDAIVGTGQVRLGPKPSPESQVAIREVISHWTNQSKPIPFLVPWGSEKPDGSGIDVAELFAFKTLSCLQHRIQAYYKPGIQINIRVEDGSAPHLFFDRQEQARIEAARYTNGFVNLAKVLGVTDFVNVIPESTMVSEATFNNEADRILPIMSAHVNNPENEDTRRDLFSVGWKVPLTNDTIGFYLDRYAKLYPDKTSEQQRYILARYFSGALARHSLGITGVSKSWDGKFLELAFTGPTPGIGANRGLRRLYYRTLPSGITSTHIPAWRAKGYLKINGEVSAGLASFNDHTLEFNPHKITLSDGTLSQEVQADYIIL